jgi:hypothetical protein
MVKNFYSYLKKYENKFFNLKNYKKELPVINFKDIIVINKNNNINVQELLRDLEIKYKDYINKKKEDNYGGLEENVSKIKKKNYFNYNKKHDYLNLLNINKNKIKHLQKNLSGTNILLNQINNISNNDISSRLLKPYYFFPRRYNERSMPSQIKN